MFWWRRQSTLKKVFYAGSVMSLAAGISGGPKTLLGGVILFILFLVIALLSPSKKKATTPSDKEWNTVITPHIPKKNKSWHILFSVIALILLTVSVFFLITSLNNDNYITALICGLVFIASLSSWVYLHPEVYNDFFSRNKIIPLSRPTTLKQLFNDVSSIKTPYGTPLMGVVEGIKEPVAVYRIIDLNWIVFFYIHGDDIIVDSRYLNTDEIPITETELVFTFIQQLADLFSFIENTGQVPDSKEIARIFYNKLNSRT